MAELAGTAGLDLVIETLAAALPSFDRKACSLHALLELPVEGLFCASVHASGPEVMARGHRGQLPAGHGINEIGVAVS